VADRLRKMTEEPEPLRALVEDARVAAWGDVRGNLDRRLRVEAMRPDQDPDYERMRDARMQALKLVDLQALSSEQRARRKREKAAEKAAEKEAAKEVARSERSARREARHAGDA
ncbi:MAG TPA: asparagine synthase, partial [Microbacterium sp.]|nr:asparagine synthase [Microbacterium sp.]